LLADSLHLIHHTPHRRFAAQMNNGWIKRGQIAHEVGSFAVGEEVEVGLPIGQGKMREGNSSNQISCQVFAMVNRLRCPTVSSKIIWFMGIGVDRSVCLDQALGGGIPRFPVALGCRLRLPKIGGDWRGLGVGRAFGVVEGRFSSLLCCC
jgi:hypothetical protein